MTILGEAELIVFLASDTPQGDIVATLVEQRSGGQLVRLAFSALRLRYREGFDREVLLTPGVPVRARVPLTYIGHCIAAGRRLRLLIDASMFPLLDPNPNTGEPIATAVRTQIARQTIFHDADRPSCLRVPLHE